MGSAFWQGICKCYYLDTFAIFSFTSRTKTPATIINNQPVSNGEHKNKVCHEGITIERLCATHSAPLPAHRCHYLVRGFVYNAHCSSCSRPTLNFRLQHADWREFCRKIKAVTESRPLTQPASVFLLVQ